MKRIYKRIHKTSAIAVMFLFFGYLASAQQNPFAAQYFNNLYLANPAYAGFEKGLSVGTSLRKQWSSIPGSPLEQNITADYREKKVGLGLNLNLFRAGLQRDMRILGTYAYHVTLRGENERLHFGLSVGLSSQRLVNSDIEGDVNDPVAVSYNERKNYFDGDVGLAYTNTKMKAEAALLNLKTYTRTGKENLTDYNTFYTAFSYRITLSEGAEGMGLEPKIAYRGIKGMDNILDLGSQFTMANRQVMFTAMYHTSKSASFGLGLNYKGKYIVNGFYTTQMARLSNYTNGAFEINLKAKF